MAELGNIGFLAKALGLRGRIVAAVAITAVVAIGLVGVISIGLLQRSALNAKAAEAAVTARLLRTAFAASKDYRDNAKTAALINDLMAGAKIRSLRVEEDNGRTVFSAGGFPAGGSLLSKTGEVEVYVIGSGFLEPGNLLYVRSLEVGDMNGSSVQFTVSLEELAADAAFMRNLLLLYAVIDALVIMVLGGYMVTSFIVRPLKKVEAAATDIASGNLDKRVDVVSRDEIGALALAFNTMADRLEGEILALGRANRELTEAKDELLKASTLASIGRLAAGLAHEVGNPLGSVSGYLGILQKSLKDRPEEKEIADRAAVEIARVNGMIRDFLNMSRPPKSLQAEADANAVATEIIELFSNDEKYKGVRINRQLDRSAPLAVIDADKLRQVFINLLRNAADAAGQGGTVLVVTGVEEYGHARAEDGIRVRGEDTAVFEKVSAERRKRFVTVSFEDNGPGMTEETLKRIFDPFFTTKDAGKGTGLGLFISNGIVKAYGGEIRATTEEGKGSVFTVLLKAK